jgi:hypothetical protein
MLPVKVVYPDIFDRILKHKFESYAGIFFLAGNLIPMADSWISMTLLLGIQFTQVQRY